MLAHAWLERLGLSELHGRCYRELSGGLRQRVLLARALCASRRLLMLDEPVSGLDPEASAEMYAALRRLNREDRLTIVMVSHDVTAAAREAGRILHLGHRRCFWARRRIILPARRARPFWVRKEESGYDVRYAGYVARLFSISICQVCAGGGRTDRAVFLPAGGYTGAAPPVLYRGRAFARGFRRIGRCRGFECCGGHAGGSAGDRAVCGGAA